MQAISIFQTPILANSKDLKSQKFRPDSRRKVHCKFFVERRFWERHSLRAVPKTLDVLLPNPSLFADCEGQASNWKRIYRDIEVFDLNKIKAYL